jgi:hypothetical protein
MALKEGPVIIWSLNGTRLSAGYALWNDIVASEFFPPNGDSAFYVLSLEKPVFQASEVVEYDHPQGAKRPSWFIDLYKVREVLKEIYAGEAKAQSMLNISNDDCRFFMRILNNYDLRHAMVSGIAEAIAAQDVDRLYRLAQSWIQAHLPR